MTISGAYFVFCVRSRYRIIFRKSFKNLGQYLWIFVPPNCRFFKTWFEVNHDTVLGHRGFKWKRSIVAVVCRHLYHVLGSILTLNNILKNLKLGSKNWIFVENILNFENVLKVRYATAHGYFGFKQTLTIIDDDFWCLFRISPPK